MEAKPPQNSAGRRLRIGESPNLRCQISILVFGFLKPFEIIWYHVLVAKAEARTLSRSLQRTLTFSYKIIVRLSVLNSVTDHVAHRLVRSDQNGLVVIKVQHDIQSNKCCLIQLSDPKIRQQAA